MFRSIIEYIDCRSSLIDADIYCEHLTRNISAAAIFIRTRVGLPIRADPGSSRGDAPAHGLEPPRRRLRSAHRRAAAAVATAGSRRSAAPGPPVIRPDRRIDSCGDGAAERRPRRRVGTRRVWGGWGRSSGAPREPGPEAGQRRGAETRSGRDPCRMRASRVRSGARVWRRRRREPFGGGPEAATSGSGAGAASGFIEPADNEKGPAGGLGLEIRGTVEPARGCIPAPTMRLRSRAGRGSGTRTPSLPWW